MEKVTRFAPSPTGYMHIGNLRTALYSYLIAKKSGGKFILRIEDTDKNRYVSGATDLIYKTLESSGLKYDEEYVQSNRLDIYKRYAEELVKNGKAYYCFCEEAKSDIDTYREECNYTTGVGYNRHCRNLTQEEIAENLKNNLPYCIRQKIEDDMIVEYEDAVYGKLTFNSSQLDDQVLIKRDGYPTYNFANVIDDHLMNITDIVRGNEYLSSTPKYVLLYKSFGWEVPNFIHLPVINGMDEEGNVTKLSKRHGSVSFEELLCQGYLSEAIINYIVFLGWNPKTCKEIYSLTELEKEFDVKKINKSDMIFDYKKLDWYNSHYMKQMEFSKFVEMTKRYYNHDKLELICSYIQNKIVKFSDIEKELEFLGSIKDFDLTLYENNKNDVKIGDVRKFLLYMIERLENIDFTKEEVEKVIRMYCAENGVKFGHGMWIYRIALSGRKNTITGGLEIGEILGKEEVLNRLQKELNRV